MTQPGHRKLIVLRGSRAATRAEAAALTAHLEATAVLWVGSEPGAITTRAVARLLGRSCDAVVLDVHDGVDADVLGQCHGFIRGGGALVLRAGDGPPEHGDPRLVVHPYRIDDVGTRFQRRFERLLARTPHARAAEVMQPPAHEPLGTPEQAGVVARLAALWSQAAPTFTALLADRGRGKSAALGLALAALRERARERGSRVGAELQFPRVALCAEHADAVREVLAFAPADPRIEVVTQGAVATERAAVYDLIIVDEAAQVPVPVLRRLVRMNPRAHLAFATTIRGYEGTGRGFALRFLSWLEAQPRPLHTLTLSAPIRWASGDPLERFVFDALLLDAEPSAVATRAGTIGAEAVRAERLDRDALAANDADLAGLFGLLVHAHHRTTPGDLHRLLDAPNLVLHVLRDASDAIVAANVCALEGGWPETLCADVAHGRTRIRAHALADSLVAHLGLTEAGRLTLVRSVRIATHPALRRAGLARRLVAHVHASHAPDLFGTIFGATPELVGFRREVGYVPVRISASRGARSGEPSLLFLRPVTDRARALSDRLRVDFARDLPLQLELLASDGTLVEPELAHELQADLPPPSPLDPATCRALVASYLSGPRTLESVAPALRRFVEDRPAALAALDQEARALITTRLIAAESWAAAARAAGLGHAGLAQRRMRPAIARLQVLDARARRRPRIPTPEPRAWCRACRRAQVLCLCAELRPFTIGFELALVMHPKEARVAIGTGRLTHRAVAGSQLIVAERCDDAPRFTSLIARPDLAPLVLFPRPDALDLALDLALDGALDPGPTSAAALAALIPPGRVPLVIVLDGTWTTAKKLMRLSAILPRLPAIRFAPPHLSRYGQLRKEPRAECWSTLEAVHELIDRFATLGIAPAPPARAHDHLLTLLAALVGRQLAYEPQR